MIADTRSGDPDNVTIMGAHLDSAPEGPGINDNGSGSAFLLEAAIRMAKGRIRTENRVRFAWWGAEESGLVGATRYLEGFEQLPDGGAHVMATLAEDRNLRESLAGGATAASAKKARKARRMSKARKAKLRAYLGDQLVR